MAAFDQAHAFGRRHAQIAAQHVGNPRSGRIDDDAAADLRGLAGARVLQGHQPRVLVALGVGQAGLNPDIGAALFRVHGVEHHQPAVLDPAIGIGEADLEIRLQRLAVSVVRKSDGLAAGQLFARRQMVVKRQSQPDQPSRPHAALMGQDEANRPDDMGGRLEQAFALHQRFAHQPKFEMFEIAQAAMDQLGRSRGGCARQIALLDHQNRQTTAGGIPRDPAAIDAAADDDQVERRTHPAPLSPPRRAFPDLK